MLSGISAMNSQKGSAVSAPAKKIRVLVVAPSFDILGGQSVQAERLLSNLKRENALEVGFLPINPRLPGILHRLQKIKYVRTVVTSIAYVASLLTRVHRYDVIHVFSASYFSFVLAPTPAILIGKLYRKKVLLNYHSGEAEDHLRRWKRTAIPTIRLTDVIIVSSDYLIKVFGQFGLRAHAIFNIIDTTKFPFRKRSPLRPVFLANRNLESHYGVDRVIKAFALLQKEFPDATLTIAGEGSQRKDLEQLAADLKLQNTTFVGRVEPAEIVTQYDAADIYLNGSEIDNQPLSIVEAFACGLPIVTTDAGGIPYIVTDGETGLIVARGDYERMAQRAIQLLKDSDTADRIIEQGYQQCRRYSWQAIKNDWLDVYFKLAHSCDSVNEQANASQEKVSGPEHNVLTR